MLRKVIGIGALGCLVALLAVSMAVAQPGGGAGGAGGQRGQRGQRGEMTPEMMQQMQERRAQMMQEQLGITAEEWKVIGPRVEKVQTLSRDLQSGGMMGMFGGRQGGRQGGRRGMMGAQEGEQTDVQKKTEALRTLLEGSPSNDAIKTALTALRQAKEKARQELATAQAQLREVLSLKQEANCVLNGILD
ncbi:MAG: hypothetical protein JW993_08180 [Sedimentisphaerales bacterium]|nr:hypothetical protein [Sedimentisphaerales bacterium]